MSSISNASGRPENNRVNLMTYINTKNCTTYVPEEWDSIYIPNLPANLRTEESLTEMFQNHIFVGDVKRVDVVSNKNDAGNTRFMAFIHFNCWYESEDTEYIREQITNVGHCDVYGYFNKHQYAYQFKDPRGRNIFLRFIRNNSPIPETELNVHQLAANAEIAQNTIIEMQARIDELENQVSSLTEQFAMVIKTPDTSRLSVPNAPVAPHVIDPDFDRYASDVASNLNAEFDAVASDEVNPHNDNNLRAFKIFDDDTCKLTYKDSSTYRGETYYNTEHGVYMFHGHGIHTRSDGTVKVGTWKDSILMDGGSREFGFDDFDDFVLNGVATNSVYDKTWNAITDTLFKFD